MSIAVSDNAALAIAAAIREQTAVHSKISTTLDLILTQATAMNTFNEKNWGTTGLATPGSPVILSQVTAESVSDIASLLGTIAKQQAELTTVVNGMKGGLSSISSGIAAGVTTQQIAVTDQIKNNKFQQSTTNAALERAGLDPTEVPPVSRKESITSAIQDVSELKLQTTAANLITDQLSQGFEFAATQITEWAKQTALGSAAISAWGDLVGLLTVTKPTTAAKAVTADTKAAARTGKLGGPSTPLPPETTWI